MTAEKLENMTHEDDVLLAIQQRLKVPKSENNEYGGYTYRSLEAINQAVKPIAAEFDSFVIYTDQVIKIGDRYYVQATCTLRTPFGQKQVTAYAREAEARKGMDAAQITGAASSYARKYAAQGLFALDGEADPDAMAPEPNPNPMRTQTQPNANPTRTQREPRPNPNPTQTLNLYNVRCRKCGNTGSQFDEYQIQHAKCYTCGATDWEIVY